MAQFPSPASIKEDKKGSQVTEKQETLLFYLAQWKIILMAFLLYADCNHKNTLLVFIENLIFFFLIYFSILITQLFSKMGQPLQSSSK